MKRVVLGLSAVLLGGAGIKVLRDRQYRKYLVDKYGAETFAKRVFVVSSVDYDTGQIDDLDLPQDFTLTLDIDEIGDTTDMQEIADYLVEDISDETGWLVDGFYFQEKMPDGTLVDLDAENFEIAYDEYLDGLGGDALILYKDNPSHLFEKAYPIDYEVGMNDYESSLLADIQSGYTENSKMFDEDENLTPYGESVLKEMYDSLIDEALGIDWLASKHPPSEILKRGDPNYYHVGLSEYQDDVEMSSFEAPYGGAGSLMDIGKETPLADFTGQELAESSAIHGDFDQASLNYSGHQNLEVRAEDVDFYELDGDDYVSKMKEMYQDFLDNWDEEWPDGDNPPSFEEWADMFMEQNASLFYAETHAYTYAYNEGHSDSRKSKEYRPNLVADRDKADFKRILKQKGD